MLGFPGKIGGNMIWLAGKEAGVLSKVERQPGFWKPDPGERFEVLYGGENFGVVAP